MTLATLVPPIHINGLQYGVIPDGVTDSSPGFVAAIAACPSGGIIDVPVLNPYGTSGPVRVSSPIVLPPNVSLMSSHWTRAILSSGVPCTSFIKPFGSFSGSACIEMLDQQQGGYSGDNNGQRLLGITLDGSALSGSIDGILASGLVHDVQLIDVAINQFPGDGIHTVSYTRLDSSQVHPYSWTLINATAFQCGNIGFAFNSCTDTTMYSCEALGSGVYGFFLTNMPNSHFTDCRAEFSGSYGFYITGGWGTSGAGSGGCSLSGCSTDRSYRDGVYIDATGNGQIVVSAMMCRRDGKNGNSGGGGYAGFTVNGATMPIVIESLVTYPGQNDDGTGAYSPEYGFQCTGATFASVNAGYLHAVTAPWNDGGGNTLLVRGSSVTGATGSPITPTRGSSVVTVTHSQTPYSIAPLDQIILVDASSGVVTATLPTAVGIGGRSYTVKKIDSSANAVTVATTSGQTIDGSTTKSLASQYNFTRVASDGANWQVL